MKLQQQIYQNHSSNRQKQILMYPVFTGTYGRCL